MMDQQVMNYLLWLKERGQGYFIASESLAIDPHVGAPRVSEIVDTAPVASVPDVSKIIDTAPVASVPDVSEPSRPAYPQYKVLFLSLGELTPPEHEMVSRIAAALSLKADDFAIAFASEAKGLADAQDHCALVLMGEGVGTLVPIKDGLTTLSIPHPGAMLKEPQLKVSAWNTLQKLKAAP